MKPLMTILALVLLQSRGAGAEEIQILAPDRSQLTLRAGRTASDSSGNITASGRVEVKHGNVEIACEGGTVKVYVSRSLFSALDAQGAIVATAAHKKLWCQHLFYEEPRRLITASGDPRVQEGGTTYRAAQRILLYTETGVMKFEPSAQILIDKGLDREKKKRARKSFLGLF
jgi:hypothetical protein